MQFKPSLPPIITNTMQQVLQDQTGRLYADLVAKYPRELETYFIALELTTADNEMIDYFTFPVMPSSISKPETKTTTVQHSLSGTTVLNKDGYTPTDITITGNFGRTFKFVLNDNTDLTLKALSYSIQDGAFTANQINANDLNVSYPVISEQVKTGYGCIKILQSIIDKSTAHDEQGRTFRLYFYNPALGEAYLVVPTKTPLTFIQNEQNLNMVWQYTLTLTILADMADVSFTNNDNRSLSKAISKANTQKSIQNAANSIGHYLNDSKETLSNVTRKTINYVGNR